MKELKKIYEAINAKLSADGKSVEFPVKNLEEFVADIGGKVTETPALLLSAEGQVRRTKCGSGEEFEILIAPNLDEQRKRFTIAHELGHLFLHMGYMRDSELWEKSADKVFSKTKNTNYNQEEDADAFAYAFLMPEDQYEEKIIELTKDSEVNISTIAEFFNVTNDVAKERGKRLGLIM